MTKRLILHAFQWELNEITESMKRIYECGFTAIQISPITPTKNSGTEFWLLYQPTHFTIGNEQIGSREDLITLCEEAAKYGIDIVADVVLRHLAGADDGSLDTHQTDDSTLTNNPEYWLPKVETFDYETRYNVTHDCFGLPGLDYFNHDVQDRYITFLDDLIDCGVSAFRVDMGKHFSLPSEGCDFWTRVFGRYADRFNYAENLGCSVELHDKYCEYINILSESGCSDNSKYVSFIETHDTYHTFESTGSMSDKERLEAWKQLLEKNRNALWFSRPFDNLTLSKELAAINWEAVKQGGAELLEGKHNDRN